ncbi:MAG: nicotinate-nucleotide adenylyltransferase, partial [Acidobacteriota bacterium]
GHSYVAQRVSEAFGLDRVLFLVSRRPPHKNEPALTSPFHRYAMTVLETLDTSNLFPCHWELARPAPSYTIQAMQHFQQRFPEDAFCFIAGSDSLRELNHWKEYGRLLSEHCFIFVQRPGEAVDLSQLAIPPHLCERIQPVQPQDRPAIQNGTSYLISLDAPDVSSTALRRILAEGGVPTPFHLSPRVLQYAKKFHLYERRQENPQESL